MSTALDRLAELVRQAESKTKAQRLGAETHQAAERLAAAEERMKLADRHLHEIRPLRLKDLEQADADETLLKELMKKLAQAFSSLESGQQREAEDHIKAAKDEIVTRRKQAQVELEAAKIGEGKTHFSLLDKIVDGKLHVQQGVIAGCSGGTPPRASSSCSNDSACSPRCVPSGSPSRPWSWTSISRTPIPSGSLVTPQRPNC